MRPKVYPKQRPLRTWEQAPLIMDTRYMMLLLGLGKSKVLRMVKAGELPVIDRNSGKFLFEKTAVMKALRVGEFNGGTP